MPSSAASCTSLEGTQLGSAAWGQEMVDQGSDGPMEVYLPLQYLWAHWCAATKAEAAIPRGAGVGKKWGQAVEPERIYQKQSPQAVSVSHENRFLYTNVKNDTNRIFF